MTFPALLAVLSYPEAMARRSLAGWRTRHAGGRRLRVRIKPLTREQIELIERFSADSRQQRRARDFASAFATFSHDYPGEPRRARRLMARRYARTQRRPS